MGFFARERAAPRHDVAERRALSLVRYRLDLSRKVEPDAQLHEVVQLARTQLRADHAAIHLFSDDAQVRLAATAGLPLDSSPLSTSMCHRVVDVSTPTGVFSTPDARADPLLADSPWVRGELGNIRGYAAAPLLGREQVSLGTLCVWSDVPMEISESERATLARLAQRVVDILGARRDAEPARGRSAATAVPRRQWTIDEVIAERAVRTLFQPVVHLASAEIVGFEALSRGPEGSSLESPIALIEAAEAAGRLGELDWLCRVHAMQAAADADLHPSLAWFINVEPAGLEIPCPQSLRPALAQARSDLRVVLEVVERGVEGHVTKLLHATDQARSNAWGIALDDVGAEEGSLALLPVLQPDVVKLSRSVVQNVDRRAAARTVAAVSAYAERRGAVVLAEGIETEEHERAARVFGAAYGQGYRYGPPGPLPSAVAAPRDVVPLRQRLEPLPTSTPFEILSAVREPRRAETSDLVHIGKHLEEQGLTARNRGLVLAGLQHARQVTPATLDVFRELARTNSLTVVLAEAMPDVAEARFRTAPLPPADRLTREWIVIVLNPHYAAAFAGHDCGDPVERTGTAGRRYDYVYTHDPDLVVAAARAFLQKLETPPRDAWLGVDAATRHDGVEQGQPANRFLRSSRRRG